MKKLKQEEAIILSSLLKVASFPIEFKNYQKLCEFLSIKPTGGDVKKKRLSFLEKAFDIIIDGRKIIINKFEDIPIATNINEISKELLCHIVENNMGKNKRKVLVAGYLSIAKKLGFINSNFSYNNKDFTDSFNNKYLKIKKYSANLGKKIYKAIYNKCKYIIDKVLTELEQEEIITFNKNWYKMPLEYKSEVYNNENTDPYFLFNISDKIQKCSDFECQTLEKIQINILNELGCTNLNDLHKKNHYQKYLDLFQQKVVEKLNIGRVFLLFEIELTDDYRNEIDDMDLTYIQDQISYLSTLNNKLFKESLTKKQNMNLDKTNATFTLEYLKIVLESGQHVIDVYSKNTLDEEPELISTTKLIKQLENSIGNQKKQLFDTIECVCTINEI